MRFTEWKVIGENHIGKVKSTGGNANGNPVDPVINPNEDHHFKSHNQENSGKWGDTEVPQVTINTIFSYNTLF